MLRRFTDAIIRRHTYESDNHAPFAPRLGDIDDVDSPRQPIDSGNLRGRPAPFHRPQQQQQRSLETVVFVVFDCERLDYGSTWHRVPRVCASRRLGESTDQRRDRRAVLRRSRVVDFVGSDGRAIHLRRRQNFKVCGFCKCFRISENLLEQ